MIACGKCMCLLHAGLSDMCKGSEKNRVLVKALKRASEERGSSGSG